MNPNIIQGDCVEILKQFSDGIFHCCFTDPPYTLATGGAKISECGGTNDRKKNKWIAKDGNQDNKDFIESGKIIKNIPKFSDWLPELYRVMKDGSHAYIMINSRNLKDLQQAAEDVGFQFQNLLNWQKQNKTPNKFYMQQVEYILMLRKGKERYINDMSAGNVFYIRNPVGKKLHPTEKPVQLVKDMIKQSIDLSSKFPQFVIDPFMGAGSAAVACKELGCEFVGIELEQKYCDIAQKRIQNVEIDFKQGGLF